MESNLHKWAVPPRGAAVFAVWLAFAFAVQLSQAGDPYPVEVEAPTVPTLGFSYDFLDIDYTYSVFDEHLDDSHGAAVKFSKNLASTLYALGGFQYDHGDYDGIPGTWDSYGIHAGLGAHFAVTERLDLTFDLVANHGWFDALERRDGWGMAIGPGLRLALSPGIEVFGAVGYRYDFRDSRDLWDYQAGAVFDIADSIGLKIGGFANKEAAGGFAGIRIYY